MLLDEIGAYLETEHSGVVVVGTNMFLGYLPGEPDSCSALLDYEGQELLASQNDDGAETEQPMLQLIVRESTYLAAATLCRTLTKTLLRIKNQTIGSTFYQRIKANQSPFQLDRDGNDRVMFAVNFSVTKEMT